MTPLPLAVPCPPLQGQGVAAIILLISGPQAGTLSDIALRRDLEDGDSPEDGGPQDTAEVFLWRDLGEEVTLSTVLGWSYVELAPESPELSESLSVL